MRRVLAAEQQACSTPYSYKEIETGKYIGMGYRCRLGEIAQVEATMMNNPLPKPYEHVLIVDIDYEDKEDEENERLRFSFSPLDKGN